MTYFAKPLLIAAALAFAGSSAAFAQAGGPDTPNDAASQGAKENGAGSTGGKGAMGGSMKKKHHHSKKKHHSSM